MNRNELAKRAANRRESTGSTSDYTPPDNFLDELDAAAQQALVPLEDGGIQVGRFILRPTGMIIEDGATVDEWQAIGGYVKRLDKSLTWIVADWMAYGNRTWGKTYEEAAAIVGRSVKTLYNWTNVVTKVDFSRRRETLDFGHHAEVAALSPKQQEELLELAVKNKWSVMKLREVVEGERPTPPDRIKRFDDFLSKTNAKLETQVFKFRSAGQGDKSQISQKLDDQIAYLEQLKSFLDSDD